MKVWSTALFSACVGLALVHHIRAQCTDEAQINCGRILTVNPGTGGLGFDYRNLPAPFLLQSGLTPAIVYNNLCKTGGGRDAAQTCINAFKGSCHPSVRLTLEGIVNAVSQLCTSGLALYQLHQPCLGGATNNAQINVCAQVSETGLTTLNWCTKIEALFDCLVRTDRRYCSSAAANYHYTIRREVYNTQATQTYSCPLSPSFNGADPSFNGAGPSFNGAGPSFNGAESVTGAAAVLISSLVLALANLLGS